MIAQWLRAKLFGEALVVNFTKDNHIVIETGRRDPRIKSLIRTPTKLVFTAPESRVTGMGAVWFLTFDEDVVAVPPKVLKAAIDFADAAGIYDYESLVNFYNSLVKAAKEVKDAGKAAYFVTISRKLQPLMNYVRYGFTAADLRVLIRDVQEMYGGAPATVTKKKGFGGKWILIVFAILSILIAIALYPFIMQLLGFIMPKPVTVPHAGGGQVINP